MARKTSKKYALFARQYLLDHNGTRSAIAAGYAPKSAHVTASQLLSNPKVQEVLAKLEAHRNSRLDIKADEVLAEIARLAYSNMGDFTKPDENGKPIGINLAELTREQWAAVQEIREDTTGGSGDGERKQILRTTLKLADKGQNLERLGRHLGLFQDNLKITGLEGLAERLNSVRKAKHAG